MTGDPIAHVFARPLCIHHIGYAVRDIERSRRTFEALGYVAEFDAFDDVARRVRILFLTHGAYRVELVCPTEPDSSVAGVISKVGDTPYHICYETTDMTARIGDLLRDKYVLVADPAPAVALGNRRVAFLYRAGIGLIELLEVGSDS